MSKPRWTIEQKRQHVAAWRASGLTRQQYCELNDIPFTSLREWPQDVAKAERRANEPTVLPVHIAPPLHADVPQPVTNERKRLARTVLIFTERSDQLSRATDRVPGLPTSPAYDL